MSSMLDSYGAFAISHTANARTIAVRPARGANNFRITSPHHHITTSTHVYSVIRGSSVQSASVRKTTSIAVRMPSHMMASVSSGGDAISAAVPRTPQMITGTVIGYNRIGSRTSRVRVRISIAPNSVPTDAKPTVPDATSAM